MPGVQRVAFNLWGLDVYWYGIIVALAITVGLTTASGREQALGFPDGTVLGMATWVIPAALVGARLYYVAFSWENYRGDLLAILDIRSGGMAIYGAVIGGTAAVYLYARGKQLSFWGLGDLVVPGLSLGQGVGRWANFVNQEAYGVAVSDPRFQFFPVSILVQRDGLWHLATFFYESIWCLGVGVLLLLREAKARHRDHGENGETMLWYGCLYGLERTVVEGLRTDSLMWGRVRVSQVLSIVLCLCAAVTLIIRRRKKKGRQTS